MSQRVDLNAAPAVPAGALHVTAALVLRGRRTLIARRVRPDALRGLWEFPGGKVEPGEAPEAALARELQEELGLAVTVHGFVARSTDAARPLVLDAYHCTDHRSVSGQSDGALQGTAAERPFDGALQGTEAERPFDGALQGTEAERPFDGALQGTEAERPFDGALHGTAAERLFDDAPRPNPIDGTHDAARWVGPDELAALAAEGALAPLDVPLARAWLARAYPVGPRRVPAAPPMLDFQASLARLAALDVPRRVERVALERALGRVLAEAVVMDRDQPAFDRSTMDGYAVVLDGARATFRVQGVVAAGSAYVGALAPGDAVRIMTGAPVPAGATVVPIELTSAGAAHAPGDVTARGPELVEVLDHDALVAGRNIARRGEDARRGDVVLAAGTRLGPVHVASAAMAGAREVAVTCAPRVAIVTTGDEVGREDAEAGVRDTNGPLLAGLCAALGVPCTRVHAADEPGALQAALARAAEAADVVVTTGGVSMGDRDLVPGTAADLGFQTVLHRVAIQPGKPVFVAQRADGTLFLGLPGNPVSVLATAHLFLVPALDRCLGNGGERWLDMHLGEAFAHAGKRHLFLPARIDGGAVFPIRWNGSGDLFSAAAGDGLLDLPVGASFAQGAPVRVLPYVGHRPGERGVLPPRGR